MALALVVAAAACGESPSDGAEAPTCAAEAEVVFWGGTQWGELADGLARTASPCAEYLLTVQPKFPDNTVLRGRLEFERIRNMNPRIRPVAEIRFTGEGGWRAWVLGPHPAWERGRTFYDAGVEARRRMAASGLDVTKGETWALNELSPEVLEDAPGWRDDVREFLRGLYDGAPGMPKARGIVFNIFVPSDTRDVATYKASLQEWLTDKAFWQDLDKYVDYFAEEVYPHVKSWGVADAPLATRVEYLNDYLFHMVTLAEAGPRGAEAARIFLRRAFLPLMNASWPHEGIGNTNVISAEAMGEFVATQVHAARTYAAAHPGVVPPDRIGFAWAPNPEEPAYSEEGRDHVLTRLSVAIRAAYEEEPDGDVGPCGATGENARCSGDVEGAFLNDAWKTFTSWD